MQLPDSEAINICYSWYFVAYYINVHMRPVLDEVGGTQFVQGCATGAFKPRPCLRQKPFISIPCI